MLGRVVYAAEQGGHVLRHPAGGHGAPARLGLAALAGLARTGAGDGLLLATRRLGTLASLVKPGAGGRRLAHVLVGVVRDAQGGGAHHARGSALGGLAAGALGHLAVRALLLGTGSRLPGGALAGLLLGTSSLFGGAGLLLGAGSRLGALALRSLGGRALGSLAGLLLATLLAGLRRLELGLLPGLLALELLAQLLAARIGLKGGVHLGVVKERDEHAALLEDVHLHNALELRRLEQGAGRLEAHVLREDVLGGQGLLHARDVRLRAESDGPGHEVVEIQAIARCHEVCHAALPVRGDARPCGGPVRAISLFCPFSQTFPTMARKGAKRDMPQDP